MAVALVLAGVLVAGCVASTPPAPTRPAPEAFVDPMASGPGHNHLDRSQHPTSYRMALVGHESLAPPGDTANSHSIDLCGHWVVLGRENPASQGVDIVDVADPAHPAWIGQYRDPNAVPGDRDVAWSADCDFVFMANGGNTLETSGVLVINAREKTKPVFESRYQIPGTPIPGPLAGVTSGVTPGVHTVHALKVGGTQYVYALNWGVHILEASTGSDGKLTLQLVGRYVAADAEQMVFTGQADPDPQGRITAERREVYAHDVAVYKEGGTVIMYVAYAYDGLRIVDITDPTQPADLGHWAPNDTPGAPHYVHSVRSYRFADGRRITVLGAETFEDRNANTPSPLWILDTTHPDAIRLLATWVNPGRHGADHLLMSLHFYEVEDQLLYLTHYHGGVWVLDLHNLTAPTVKGYYMPELDTGFDPPPNCCTPWKFGAMPMTFDIKVRDGLAYAADYWTGLYVLRLAG